MQVDSSAQLALAIETSAPGEWIIYHTGDLSSDRANKKVVDDLGTYAQFMAMRGTVLLVQRRIAFRVFDYIAAKAKKPRPLPPNLWGGIEKPHARKYKMAMAA